MAHTVQCKNGNVPTTRGKKSRFKGFRAKQPSYNSKPIDLRHFSDLSVAQQKIVSGKDGYKFF